MNELLRCILDVPFLTSRGLALLLLYIVHLDPYNPWTVTIPVRDLCNYLGGITFAELGSATSDLVRIAFRLPVNDPENEFHIACAMRACTLSNQELQMQCGLAAVPLLCMLHRECRYIADNLDDIIRLPDVSSKCLYLVIAAYLAAGTPAVLKISDLYKYMQVRTRRARRECGEATLRASLDAVRAAMQDAFDYEYVSAAKVRIIPNSTQRG